MRVIVTKAFGAFSVGQIIPDMPNNQARGMIARGVVREDVSSVPQADLLKRDMPSPADRMMRSGRERRAPRN
jgi:hypothetical protein